MKTKATTTAEKFADIMLKKMEEMKTEKWEIPWFSDTNKINFYPQNYTGRKYESGNAFFLLLCCTWENYTTPIFLTFNQCRKLGVCVKKKEQAFPIYYRNWIAYHKETKEKLNLEEYNKLTDTEKEKYRLVSYVNYYNVFNLDQTDFSEKQPEKWSVFVERFNKKEELKIDNAFDCPQMDNMLNNDAWVCSINLRKQNKAYYSPSSDVIVSPLKEQFPNQHLFYSVLLHEMTHSTGTKERLNRAMGKVFGDDEYAHEEVVAELTAAFTGFQLGVFAEPNKDSAAYLNGWIRMLKKKPEYVFSVLDDVVKASNYITEHLASQVNQQVREEVAV